MMQAYQYFFGILTVSDTDVWQKQVLGKQGGRD